jgi:hypothetical protein
MDLVPVTRNGDYMEINPVAVNEHLALGWVICDPQPIASVKRMSIAEIREALTAKGINFDVSLGKVKLQSLLDAADVASDAAPVDAIAVTPAQEQAPATDFKEAAQ